MNPYAITFLVACASAFALSLAMGRLGRPNVGQTLQSADAANVAQTLQSAGAAPMWHRLSSLWIGPEARRL